MFQLCSNSTAGTGDAGAHSHIATFEIKLPWREIIGNVTQKKTR